MLPRKSTSLKVLESFLETTWKWIFIFMLFFGICTFAFSSLEPIILSKIISQIEKFYIKEITNFDSILFLIYIWGLYIVLKVGSSYIFDYYFSMKYSIANFHDIIEKFSVKIIEMGYGEYLTKKTGSIYKILDRGTDSQFFFTRDMFAEVLANIVIVIMSISVLFYYDIRMSLITLIPLPIMLYIGYFIYKKLAPSQLEMDRKYDEVFYDIGNVMSNFSLTKLLGLELFFTRKIQDTLHTNYKTQIKLNAGWSLSHVYVTAIVMFARILVIGFWAYFIIRWELSFAILFLFFTYVNFIYYPMSFIFIKLRQFQKQLVSIERMYSELGGLEKDERDTGKKLERVSWDIRFKNICFGYQQDQNILKNIDMEIPAWKKIAIVWGTGAGKSTLINLLLRFWDIESGEIFLDWINIQEYKKSSLRNHIGVVSQDNSLFNLSIEENLKFANPKASKKDIEEALRKAEAHFVFELPQGVKTIIGERGLKLSGGEKQRISIARLFLKNPEILILDEATSALDNTTERLIQKSLERLQKGKTSIIIAHRLSTIRHADKIYVIEKGKIVESGTYDELMEKWEKFYTLANPDKLILG